MMEVAATRKYCLRVKSGKAVKKIAEHLNQRLRAELSPNICEIETVKDTNEPRCFSIILKCVDGKAVHKADVRSMFSVLQLCEKEGIIHEIGDLEVLPDE